MEEHRTARLVAIAVLALLLFNAPLLALFDGPALVLGLPLAWLYLLASWLVVVLLVQRAVRDGGHDRDDDRRAGRGRG